MKEKKSKKKYKGNEILVTNTGLYQGNGKILYIAGKQNAGQDTVGTIASPVQAQGVVIDADVSDPAAFSFTWQGKPRLLLVKINKVSGQPSTCTVRLLAPKAVGEWKSLSGDVYLGSAASPLLRSPQCLAQWGNILYLIDYETQQIVLLGANELKGMSGDYTPVNHPFDLTTPLAEPDSKGRAIIALGGKLFALYVTDRGGASVFQYSTLIRMDIAGGGAPVYETQSEVGMNAQSIIPVNDGSAIQLLVPANGDFVSWDGHTNGTFSNICVVPAFGTWPATAQTVVTGDDYFPPPAPAPADPPTYDFLALAAAARKGGSMLYILTQVNRRNPVRASWRIYRTTVSDFLSLITPYPYTTLTAAVNAGKLEVLDEGTVGVDNVKRCFWDLLYEQIHGPGDIGDRLWVALGTSVMVTRAAAGAYGSPTIVPPQQNPFTVYGFKNSGSVNSLELTIDAVTQAKRDVSLKRGMKGRLPPLPPSGEQKAEIQRIREQLAGASPR
jgi:hypothetical protein